MKNAMRCVSFLLHFGIIIRIRKSRDYVQKEDFLCKISLIKIIFEFNSSGNVSKSVCESHKRKLITRKKWVQWYQEICTLKLWYQIIPIHWLRYNKPGLFYAADIINLPVKCGSDHMGVPHSQPFPDKVATLPYM